MRVAVLIPAAGLGKRFAQGSPALGEGGPAKDKLLLDLAGKPAFLRSVELFLNRPEVGKIILAVNPDGLDAFRFSWGDKLGFMGVMIVAGGRKERWETVREAMKAAPADCTHIAIHDAARPLASQAMIDRVFQAAATHPAVIPATPVSATVKRVRDLPTTAKLDVADAILGSTPLAPKLKQIVESVDRAPLVLAQTPQVFERSLLLRALAQLDDPAFDAKLVTDDAYLVERLGVPVVVVEGETNNLKITHPEDAELAQALTMMRQAKEAAALAKKRLFGDEPE